jgi:hypothetical protein
MLGIKILATIILYLPFCAVALMSLVAAIPGSRVGDKGLNPLRIIRYATVLIWIAGTAGYIWFLSLDFT